MDKDELERRLNAIWQQMRDNIARTGFHVTGVMATREEPVPTFCYTVGIFETFGRPELLSSGVPYEIAYDIFQDAACKIRSGEPIPLDVPVLDLANLPVVFKRVDVAKVAPDRLRMANLYYRDRPWEAIQMVIPDTSGRFPWDEGYEQFVQELVYLWK